MTIADPLIVVISKEEVLSRDCSQVLDLLSALIESPNVARNWRERVDIAVDGYNSSGLELFEIEEVRDFIQAVDAKFPFWLYFLTKQGLGLQFVAHCFLPPFLTPKARQTIFPERLDELLTRRWFPAMNQICEWSNVAEEQIEEMSERAVRYLVAGPLP